LIFLVLISGVYRYVQLQWIHSTLLCLTIILPFYIIITILNAFGYWPDMLYYEFSGQPANKHVADKVLGLGGGIIDTGFASMPSLLFLQPYLVCYLLTNKRSSSWVLWIGVIISTIVMMFTGRRILLIVAVLLPVIIIVSLYLLDRKNRILIKKIKQFLIITVLSLLVMLFFLLQLGFNPQAFFYDIIKAFLPYEIWFPTGSVEIIENRRWKQISELFLWWKERPFFGFGSGAVHSSYVRSIHSWKFEMIYSAFLVNWGIIGCLCYAAGIFSIFKTSIKIYREKSQVGRYALASAFGMMGFLIGSGTNPYLLMFDYLVIIFIPIAVINYWLNNRHTCSMCNYGSAGYFGTI
jgi:hypothetical protein